MVRAGRRPVEPVVGADVPGEDGEREESEDEEHEEDHGRDGALVDIPPLVADMPGLLDILPDLGHTTEVLRDIAAVVVDGVAPFELGVVCEVFGTDRTADGFPAFDFAVCSPGGQPVQTTAGFVLQPSHGLDRLACADLVAVPALPVSEVPGELLDALRAAAARGARVLSLCTGAFVLGEAGLLDGRDCTTHWRHAAELAERFPAARVDANVLYVEDGPVITSAGTAAGIDASLHVIRAELGVDVATAFARRMVVPPHRDGGQAQYVQTPVVLADAESLQGLLDWVCGHLDEPHTVESLAARAHLSPRTFARRFRAETGTTPYAWLSARRVELAQSLLETTDEPVERIAVLTGFGGPAALRHHFTAAVRTTPQAYRRTFQCPDVRAG